MTMTYKEAMQVLHHMQQGTKLEAKEVNEAVEVMFENEKQIAQLETKLVQEQEKVKNRNTTIEAIENYNNRLRNDNQAKKKVLEKRNRQLTMLRAGLKEIAEEAKSFIDYYSKEEGDNIEQINMSSHFGTLAQNTLEESK